VHKMIKGSDVLAMLRPNGGWIMRDNDFDQIQWISCEPLTRAEFEAGFKQYEVWKNEQDTKAKTNKANLLSKLGITEDEARLLLS
jgi:hypothetical protein